jgi:LPS-assembly lipoprotein
MKRGPRLLGGLALAVLLAGCGFQLRGSAPALEAYDQPIFLAGLAPFSPLHRDLSRALQEADVQLSDAAAGASVLRVSDYESTRRVLSVDSRNKVVEFELEESFRFSLHSADGVERAPSQRLRTLRIYLNPEIQVLGRATEEELLRADMRRELAQQLVTRLSHQL